MFAVETNAGRQGNFGSGRHGWNLQSSIRGLGCRRGNHENAAGCKVAVRLLDRYGVGDASGLQCHAASLNSGYRNTSRDGNSLVAVLIAHHESRAATLLQDTIGHARTRLGGWLF